MGRRRAKTGLRKLGDVLLFLAVAGALLYAIANMPGGEHSGTARAIDGDSLMVGAAEIRLFGIDAPEAQQICKTADGEDWHCGRDAARALGRLVDGATLACKVQEEDRYGRDVSRCHAGERDLAADMVQQGLAVVLPEGLLLYAAAEADARAAQRGIWQGEFEEPASWRALNQ